MADEPEATYFRRLAEIIREPECASTELSGLSDVILSIRDMEEALSALDPPSRAASAHERFVKLVGEELEVLSSHGEAILGNAPGAGTAAEEAGLVAILQAAHDSLLELVGAAKSYGVVLRLPESGGRTQRWWQ